MWLKEIRCFGLSVSRSAKNILNGLADIHDSRELVVVNTSYLFLVSTWRQLLRMPKSWVRDRAAEHAQIQCPPKRCATWLFEAQFPHLLKRPLDQMAIGDSQHQLEGRGHCQPSTRAQQELAGFLVAWRGLGALSPYLPFKEVYVWADQTKALLKLTYESEDVFDGRHEDDQHVVERDDDGSDPEMFHPAEGSSWKQQRDHRSADLQRGCAKAQSLL